LAIGGDKWPVLIVVERLVSVQLDLFTVETMDENTLGVRRMWGSSEVVRFRPYVNDGFAIISGGVGTNVAGIVYSVTDSAL